jgi:hypothetical protein
MIILLVGLPASGKTYLMQHKFSHFDILIDDPIMLENILNQTFKNMVIADPYFCINAVLEKAVDILQNEYPMHKIIIEYFENNPIQCKLNAINRINKDVDTLIDMLSMSYNPPYVDYIVYKGK